MRFGLRELVFLLVLLAVPVASLFYVFKPRNAEIESAMQEIERKEARLARLAEVSQRIEDLGKAIEEGREELSRLEAMLPDREGVDAILDEFHIITARHGLTARSIKTDREKSASGYRELPLEVVLEGSFPSIYRFLVDLENIERITRMTDLVIAKAPDQSPRAGENAPDTRNPRVRAEFTLGIYFKPDNGGVG